MEFPDPFFFTRFDKTRQLFHVYILVEFSIKISVFEVNLMDFPVILSSKSKDELYRRKMSRRGHSFIVINTRDLGETLSTEMSLELDNLIVYMSFLLQSPHTTSNVHTRWWLNHRVCFHLLNHPNLSPSRLYPMQQHDNLRG